MIGGIATLIRILLNQYCVCVPTEMRRTQDGSLVSYFQTPCVDYMYLYIVYICWPPHGSKTTRCKFNQVVLLE